jgi:hypothetical protein
VLIGAAPCARPPPSCAHCGDRIGRYEAIVAMDPDCIRITSLSREPEIETSDFELLHRHCFLRREPRS